MSDRCRLPNRRDNTSHDFVWNGGKWTLSVGWAAGDRVGEIFLKGAKEGADMAIVAEDAAFVVSRALQRGESVQDLARSLDANRPRGTGDAAPSLIACAVTLAADLESRGDVWPFRTHRTMADVLDDEGPAR